MKVGSIPGQCIHQMRDRCDLVVGGPGLFHIAGEWIAWNLVLTTTTATTSRWLRSIHCRTMSHVSGKHGKNNHIVLMCGEVVRTYGFEYGDIFFG